MATTISTDICIIGAGSGGLSVAAGAAQLGKKTVLIEKDKMGGDCLNYGCVPSKALLAAAKQAQCLRQGEKFGIAAVEPEIDFKAVHDHVHGVIETIAPHDSQERFEGLGVTVLRDFAKFIGPRAIQAGEVTVTAKHFIIATGSSPFVPPIKGIDTTPYLTNETIFERTEKPEHLIVIGGGPIGIEMAQAHRRLGAKVTLIEGATILPRDDAELVAIVRDTLIKEGMTILEGAMVDEVSGPQGNITVKARLDGQLQEVQGSHLLVATGRKANVEGLGLEKAGVAYDRRGIKVTDKLRSTNKRIYAIGDVAGGRQFTHVAGYHAGLIIQNLLFKLVQKSNKEDTAPWVTYCDPELAQIGLTAAEAEQQNIHHEVIPWSFHENDRALAEHAEQGKIKLVLGQRGKILGASIVGKNAGDLITPWAMAVANGYTIRAFTTMIAAYPTLSEASKRAAGAYYTPSLFSPRSRKLVRLLSIFD